LKYKGAQTCLSPLENILLLSNYSVIYFKRSNQAIKIIRDKEGSK
jgi:hypothetical protein